MKKITLTILASIVLFACNNEPKNYVVIKGKTSNTTAKTLEITNPNYTKKITINADGTFNDTLHLKVVEEIKSYEENIFRINLGQSVSYAYLKNGFELNFTIDGTDYTIKGKGAENTNYIKDKIQAGAEYLNIPSYFELEKTAFESKVAEAQQVLDGLLEKYPSIDTAFVSAEKKSNQELYKILKENYEAQHNIAKATSKGSKSPSFENYENYKGGNSSLADFKGKYVYIDVWATWCGPCKQQIPHLQKLEKNYHGKNIEFVSISVDQPGAKDTWKNMIKEKNMGGVQLFANGDQAFMQAYNINGIPRFILIDPQGNIVDPNAPRPSDPSLISLFDNLEI